MQYPRGRSFSFSISILQANLEHCSAFHSVHLFFTDSHSQIISNHYFQTQSFEGGELLQEVDFCLLEIV